MMDRVEKGILFILLSALFVTPVSIADIPEMNDTPIVQVDIIDAPLLESSNYTPHEPIFIDDPTDFTSLGFPGDGSESDPFVISNISIRSPGVSLEIVGISDYIEIRNCTFAKTNSSGYFDGESVVLDSLRHVTIYYCDIINSTVLQKTLGEISVHSNKFIGGPIGCSLNSTANVKNNTFINCKWGINSWDNGSGTIRNNTMISCGNGIRLTDAKFLVTENSFFDCYWGVCHFSDKGRVDNNRFYRNELAIISDVPVTNNLIENCTKGIKLGNFYLGEALNNKITSFVEYGITLDMYSYGAILRNNIIHGQGVNGIEVIHGFANHFEFTNNSLENCGISFRASGISVGMEFQNNTINGLPLGFFNDTPGVEVLDSTYGQIILLNCSNSLVSNANFPRVPFGVTIVHSNNSIVTNCTFIDCYGGILQRFSYGVIVDSSMFINCGFCLTASSMDQFPDLLENCTVNGRPLTYLRDVSNQELIADDHGQIIVVNCANISIREGTISNATMGIILAHSTNCIIENVTLDGHRDIGLYLRESTHNIVNGCLFVRNDYGYIPYASSHNLIVNNTFIKNRIGINSCGAYSQFYYNVLGSNTEWNVRTSSIYAVWDDSSGCGNWWDDWDGSGFYLVDEHVGWLGEPSIFIVDRFPNGTRIDQTIPQITHPKFLEFNVDEEPKTILWNCSDDNSRFYFLYINDTLVESYYWHYSEDIETVLDLTVVGVYNVTLLLEDFGMNQNSGTVIVRVFEEAVTTTTIITTVTPSPPTSTSSSITSTTIPTTPTSPRWPTFPTEPPPSVSQALVLLTSVISGVATALVIIIIVHKRKSV